VWGKLVAQFNYYSGGNRKMTHACLVRKETGWCATLYKCWAVRVQSSANLDGDERKGGGVWWEQHA
jgi:hypothetical protein